MSSINWKAISPFYSQVWEEMPVNSQLQAQTFMDLIMARVATTVAHLPYSYLPGWSEHLMNEMVCLLCSVLLAIFIANPMMNKGSYICFSRLLWSSGVAHCGSGIIPEDLQNNVHRIRWRYQAAVHQIHWPEKLDQWPTNPLLGVEDKLRVGDWMSALKEYEKDKVYPRFISL